jgi:hypothetical protein
MRAAGTISIVLAWLSFTYMPHLGFWLAPLGTLTIVGIAVLTLGRGGLETLGVAMRGRSAAGSVVLLVATVALAGWLVAAVADAGGVDYRRDAGLVAVAARLLHAFGQTGNEEIVLGALLLGAISRGFPRMKPLTVSLLVAATFAALHFAFYAFRPEDAYNHGYLTPLALVSVLAAGVLRNNLILAHGHIGYAWAVHLGWNLFFMGGSFVTRGEPGRLDEPERFNLVMGHPLTAGVTITAAAFAAWYLMRRRPPRDGEASHTTPTGGAP